MWLASISIQDVNVAIKTRKRKSRTTAKRISHADLRRVERFAMQLKNDRKTACRGAFLRVLKQEQKHFALVESKAAECERYAASGPVRSILGIGRVD